MYLLRRVRAIPMLRSILLDFMVQARLILRRELLKTNLTRLIILTFFQQLFVNWEKEKKES